MKIIIISFFCFLGYTGFSQTHQDTAAMLIGKWVVCDEWDFKPDFNYKVGFTSYEFSSNDNCLDQMKKYTKWKLEGNNLILLDNYEVRPTHAAISYPIIWLDRNRFYSKVPYGANGTTKFIYFTRKIK